MAAPWNDLRLSSPPNSMCVLTREEVKKIGQDESKVFYKVLQDATRVLRNQQALQVEGALLSRMIYRMKHQFRADKGYQTLKRVKQALRRYLALDLLSAMANFADTVPRELPVNPKRDIHMPTRQMLQYLLVRIQAFSKITVHIYDCCKRAAPYLFQRMAFGQYWNVALINLATLSRIWVICHGLTRWACEWWDVLYPWLCRLNLVGCDWLPEDCELPNSLRIWLDCSWLDDVPGTQVKKMIRTVKCLDNFRVEHREEMNTLQQSIVDPDLLDILEDIGESVSRHELMPVAAGSQSVQSQKVTKKAEVPAASAILTTVDDIGQPVTRSEASTSLSLAKETVVKKSNYDPGLDMTTVVNKSNYDPGLDMTTVADEVPMDTSQSPLVSRKFNSKKTKKRPQKISKKKCMRLPPHKARLKCIGKSRKSHGKIRKSSGWTCRQEGMGLLNILHNLRSKEKEFRILLLGLDNAGKSSIYERLIGNDDIESLTTTKGYRAKTLEYKGSSLSFWDVGGQESQRSYWHTYFDGTDGIIWIVDSKDQSRFLESGKEFQQLMSDERLNTPILILANKQDKPKKLVSSMLQADLTESLQLKNVTRYKWKLQCCSALMGDNIYSGIEWIVEEMSKRDPNAII